MNCENYVAMMDDFLDSALSPIEREALEKHLKECGDCRSEIQSLQSLARKSAALPRNLRPDRDLWPTIEMRIRITGVPPRPAGQKDTVAEAGGGRQADPSAYRWGWRIAAAAVVGTVLVFAATRLITRQVPATSKSATTSPAPQENQKNITAPTIPDARQAPVIPSLPAARNPGRTGPNAQAARGQRTEIIPSLADTALPEPVKPGEGNPQVIKPGPPAPSDSASGWALEVITSVSRPPAYLGIPDTATFTVVVGNRRRKPESEPTGRLVRIRSTAQKNAVAVGVAVVDGSFRLDDMDDQGRPERIVATYRARLGDQIRVDELLAFDIDPFELRVVSDRPAVPTPLQVTYKTSSIRVSAAQESVGGRYQLTLRNWSMRTAAGLAYRLANSSGMGMINTSIPPFGTAKILLSFGPRYQMNAAGQYEPDPRLPAVLLSMVTFADGSYEGEAESAALFYAQMKGVPLLYARKILPLLTQALQSLETLPADATAERLRAEIAALAEDAEPEILDEIFRRYPAVTRTPEFEAQLKSDYQSGLKRQKGMMLVALNKNTKEDGRIDAASLRRWLSDQKEIFEKILAKPGR
jgi:hypothetical protein